MKKLLPLLLFLVPAVSFGQGSVVNDLAFKNLVTGIAPAAGATVTVCTSAGTGIPCTPLATVYSDIALTKPITPPILADSNGYYSFFAPSGTYIVTITGAGTSGRSVTYTLPFTLSGNNAFSGINTFSGALNSTNSTTGISACIENSMYVAGSSCYATIQAAITAAGTTGSVLIPYTYAGIDVYTNPNGITVLDLRGGTSATGGFQIGQGIATGLGGIIPGNIGNTVFGVGAMQGDTIGYDNTAFGLSALALEQVGAANTAFGRSTLTNDTYGRFNVGIGYRALQQNVSGGNNTAVGVYSMGSADNNTHILIGDNNTAVGSNTLTQNVSGADNNALGETALSSNITGSLNNAVGSAALNVNTTGSQNTAIGHQALVALKPTSGAITVFTNGGGGTVQATSASHGLSNGNSVTISGSTVTIPNPAIAPLLSQNASGGSIGATTYFFKITLFHCTHSTNPAADCPTNPPQTETLASPEGSIVVAAGSTNQLIVTRPALRPALADGFCVYASTTTGNETKQGCEVGFSYPGNLPGTFTLNTCCSAGAAVPVANTTAGNNYNGTFVITVVDANNFKWTATFVGTQNDAWWTLNNPSTPTNQAFQNTAIGYGSGSLLTTGTQNTLVGALAGPTGPTTGNFNTIIGASSGNGLVTGSGNTIIGAQANGFAAGITNNIILTDGNGAVRLQHDGTGAGWAYSNGFHPAVAGTDMCTALLPCGRIFLGPTTANQTVAYTPGAMGGNRVVNILDPGAAAVNEMFSSNTSTTVTQVPHATATAGVYTNSAIVTADIATALTTPGPIGGTTPGTGKFTSMTATNLLWSTTAPTIAGAGCGGSVATISANNGTAAFSIFTGTAPLTTCTVTMPAATTGWVCEANTVSATTTTNYIVKQTGAVSTTSVVLSLFTDVAVAQNFTASDTIRVKCTAY